MNIDNDLSALASAQDYTAVPLEQPLEMPTQNLWNYSQKTTLKSWLMRVLAIRLLVFGSAITLSIAGVAQMIMVVKEGGIVGFEWMLIVLFAINFSWIALAASSCAAGFICGMYGMIKSCQPKVLQSPCDSPIKGMTAIIMPIHNEDVSRVFGSLEAMAKELMSNCADSLNANELFEIFVLSDTRKDSIIIKEELAVTYLRQRLDGNLKVWYRHRANNAGRKAGNISDFIRHWGGRYDHMLVLDADSIMEGQAVFELARAMTNDPQAGIIQSLPIIANRNTLFARLQQFAGRVYGPVIARGLAVWHHWDGNYWGHNAIIRVRAFAESCGLPELGGRRPFGGHIMSHDFIEAALIRRAGWKVYMLPALQGSYEESPPSILDVLLRDRRWTQGNLQHIPLIFTKGLSWVSRVHLCMGVMSYIAAPFWLMLIIAGLALSIQLQSIPSEYFTQGFSLFPAWPRFDSERALSLFLATMMILLLPKVLGTIETMCNQKVVRDCGGRLMVLCSLIIETLISAFVAPIMMIGQSRYVLEILCGNDAGWTAQRRSDGGVPFFDILRYHSWHAVIGVAFAAISWGISNSLLVWMAPVLLGLCLAVPISYASGSFKIGSWLRVCRILLIPEETNPPSVLTAAAHYCQYYEDTLPVIEDGLLFVLEHPAAKIIHMRFMLPQPPTPRGKPIVEVVMTEAKMREATTLVEFLSWLSQRDRLAVLNNHYLLAGCERLL